MVSARTLWCLGARRVVNAGAREMERGRARERERSKGFGTPRKEGAVLCALAGQSGVCRQREISTGYIVWTVPVWLTIDDVRYIDRARTI